MSEDLKINPDHPEVTCHHGYYPYCPTCEHGYVYQAEWMQDDTCEWICLLDQGEGRDKK